MKNKVILKYELLQFLHNGKIYDEKPVIADFDFVEMVFNEFDIRKKNKKFDLFIDELYSKGIGVMWGHETYIEVRCRYDDLNMN